MNRIAELLDAKLRTLDERMSCSIVLAELLHGAAKYGNPMRRIKLIETTLDKYASLPFDDSAAKQYAATRHELQTAGVVIGPYDLQIAAICLVHNLTLITGNVREFSRVPGLAVEDWTSGTY